MVNFQRQINLQLLSIHSPHSLDDNPGNVTHYLDTEPHKPIQKKDALYTTSDKLRMPDISIWKLNAVLSRRTLIVRRLAGELRLQMVEFPQHKESSLKIRASHPESVPVSVTRYLNLTS